MDDNTLTDNFHLGSLPLRQTGRGFESRWWGLHSSHLLLILRGPEAAKEPGAASILSRLQGRAVRALRERLPCLGVNLGRLAGLLAFIHDSHRLGELAQSLIERGRDLRDVR